MDNKVVLLCLLLALVRPSQQQYASGQCLESSAPGVEFDFVIRVNPSTSATTGAQAYDASDALLQTKITDSGCSSTTLQDGVYKLTISVNTGTTPCGLKKTGNKYEFAVCAEGSGSCYRTVCETGGASNLQTLPTSVSETDYGTLHPGLHKEFGYLPVDVQFDVFESGGTNAPISEAKLGETLRLDLIYNRGFEEKGNNNWGYSFHTSFLRGTVANTEYILEIVTPGLGTLVDLVIGDDQWTRTVFVKRNNRAYVTIPNTYVTGTYDATVWQDKEETIKITARNDRIGVRAITVQGTTTPVPIDSYVVLPDNLLGISYRANPFPATSNGEFVLVFKESATIVTFDFNDGSKTLTIAGETVTSATSFTLTNAINGFKVLRVYCDDWCEHLKVSADQPFAAIFGNTQRTQNKLVLTQLNPDNRVGSEYVFVEVPALMGGNLDFLYYIRATAASTTIDDATQTGQTVPENDVLVKGFTTGPAGAYAYEANNPVSVFLFVKDSTFAEDNYVQYPSMDQWGIHQSFYSSKDLDFSIIVVAEKNQETDIKISGHPTADDLGDFGVTPVEVTPPVSGAATHEMFAVTNFMQGGSTSVEGLIEFRSKSPTKRFMLIVARRDANGHFTMDIPFGQRYPPVCSAATVVNMVRGGYNFGNTVANNPGDNLDNDCDGKVDEELLNGVDDDNDKYIDEDVAIVENDLLPLAVKVVKLEVAGDNTFSGTNYKTVIDNGCLTTAASKQPLSDLGPFTHQTNLGADFDNYWVVSSPVFRAFRFYVTGEVFFRVTFGFCVGDVTASTSECTTSCQTSSGKRKKRSLLDEEFTMVKGVRIRNGTMTMVDVIGDDEEHHPCYMEPTLIVPAVLLLLILLVECVCTGYMLIRRFQLKRAL